MLLEIDSLCLSFGGLKAINNVSTAIEAHKINGLIGPNGAGKTTFFNLISGVYKPDSGSYLFDGKHIEGMKPFPDQCRGHRPHVPGPSTCSAR
jgi:branched-chain amino acid transport system ATP-binding protein